MDAVRSGAQHRQELHLWDDPLTLAVRKKTKDDLHRENLVSCWDPDQGRLFPNSVFRQSRSAAVLQIVVVSLIIVRSRGLPPRENYS